MKFKIKYFNERTCSEVHEEDLTRAEYNARMGDLRAMELGGHVSNISGARQPRSNLAPIADINTPLSWRGGDD